MCVSPAEIDVAVQEIQGVVGAGYGVKFNARIGDDFQIREGTIGLSHSSLTIGRALKDLYDLVESARTNPRLLVVVEMKGVGAVSGAYGKRQTRGVKRGGVRHEWGVVRIYIDVIYVITFMGLGGVGLSVLGVGNLHGDGQRVVVEAAVNFVSDEVFGEEIITGVAKPFRDDVTLLIEIIGVVDVANFCGETLLKPHDMLSQRRVFNLIVDVADTVRFGEID